jgi:membrane protein required for colicin V production
LAVVLEPWIASPSIRLGAAFAVLLILTLVVGGLVNYLLGQLVDRTGLSGTDRVIGMLFGAVRGVLLVVIVVLLAGLTPLPSEPWWQQSSMIAHFQELAAWLQSLLPPDIAERFQYVHEETSR